MSERIVMPEDVPEVIVKRRKGGQHIHFGNLDRAVFYTPSFSHEREGTPHKAGEVYVGARYRKLKQDERSFSDLPVYEVKKGKMLKPSEVIKLMYDPAHVANQLSHENLHIAMHRVGAREASRSIDKRDIFGGAEDISPSGLLHYDIIQRNIEKERKTPWERALEQDVRRARRLGR